MQPYQEEYIKNLKQIAVLTSRKKPNGLPFEAYREQLIDHRRQVERMVARNMELLKKELFPVLDHLLEAGTEQLQELQEFAQKLFQVGEELDTGLFCKIHQALLSLARLTKDQNGMIRELYWLGLGRHSLCSKLEGLDMSVVDPYMSEMRLCFTEAAAYLKYFDQIEDSEIRGYILRSRANMSLGQFWSAGEKIKRVKQTLQILEDKYYQEKEPDLPWEKYIFMTHRQMADSISYNKEKGMSAQDVEAIMESVYIVYQTRIQGAVQREESPLIQAVFSYYAISYYCGLDTLDGLLTKMERLMDISNSSDFSPENMYGLISLPAFYCQYLRQYPDRIPSRKAYIEELYRKILDYVERFPDAPENETLFLYLRQLVNHFVETENSIPYGEFLLTLLARFAPHTYMHSYIVAKAATIFCRIIMEEEPGFFDDIDLIREEADPGRKQQKVLDYAMTGGLFHDAGKINFINLYSQTGRQWFEGEYEMTRLHTVVGSSCLAERASTRHYAAIALGHHSWYDGSGGYPDSYKRLECPYRQMVDVIGLIDWIENVTDSKCLHTGVKMTFDEAIKAAIALEGRRFSPLLTARFRDEKIISQIKAAFADGRIEAGRQLFMFSIQPAEEIRKVRV